MIEGFGLLSQFFILRFELCENFFGWWALLLLLWLLWLLFEEFLQAARFFLPLYSSLLLLGCESLVAHLGVLELSLLIFQVDSLLAQLLSHDSQLLLLLSELLGLVLQFLIELIAFLYLVLHRFGLVLDLLFEVGDLLVSDPDIHLVLRLKLVLVGLPFLLLLLPLFFGPLQLRHPVVELLIFCAEVLLGLPEFLQGSSQLLGLTGVTRRHNLWHHLGFGPREALPQLLAEVVCLGLQLQVLLVHFFP